MFIFWHTCGVVVLYSTLFLVKFLHFNMYPSLMTSTDPGNALGRTHTCAFQASAVLLIHFECGDILRRHLIHGSVVVQSNHVYLMVIAPAKTPPKTPGAPPSTVDAVCMCESCLIQCLLPEWVLSNFDRLDEMVRRWKEMWCDIFFSEVSQATSQVDLLTSKEATSQNKAFCTSF